MFMDLTGGFGARSVGSELDSLHLADEFRQFMTLPHENGSFTALLELPDTEAVELLHFTDSSSYQATVTGIGGDIVPPLHSFKTLTFSSNSVLTERAARFSVIATEENRNISGDTTTSSTLSNSRANLDRVKTEPAETDSSQRLISDPAVENQIPSPCQSIRSGKRKVFEKKVNISTKKKKTSEEETKKLPYVHVRAPRGQATNSHSLAERARREKINARMKLLQELVPGCDKIQGTALVLDEIINHVQSLQRQVEMLSMRLAAVNPRIEFDLDKLLASENCDGSFNSTAMQLAWPHQVIETEQSYHNPQLEPPPPQQWSFEGLNQSVWERGVYQAHSNNHNNLMAVSENLVGYANLHPNQVKMKLY